jgi:hypothetical protein
MDEGGVHVLPSMLDKRSQTARFDAANPPRNHDRALVIRSTGLWHTVEPRQSGPQDEHVTIMALAARPGLAQFRATSPSNRPARPLRQPLLAPPVGPAPAPAPAPGPHPAAARGLATGSRSPRTSILSVTSPPGSDATPSGRGGIREQQRCELQRRSGDTPSTNTGAMHLR